MAGYPQASMVDFSVQTIMSKLCNISKQAHKSAYGLKQACTKVNIIMVGTDAHKCALLQLHLFIIYQYSIAWRVFSSLIVYQPSRGPLW